MKEKDLQVLLSNWIKENPFSNSCALELKIVNGTSLSFDSVKEHQIAALQAAKGNGLYHKISDSPVSWMKSTRMRFGKPKPCDAVFVKGDAYVVLGFYRPRELKRLFFIDVDRFLWVKATAKRKSMTMDMADEVASLVVDL